MKKKKEVTLFRRVDKEGDREDSPHAWIKKFKFALNLKHALFDAIL